MQKILLFIITNYAFHRNYHLPLIQRFKQYCSFYMDTETAIFADSFTAFKTNNTLRFYTISFAGYALVCICNFIYQIYLVLQNKNTDSIRFVFLFNWVGFRNKPVIEESSGNI